MMSALHVLKFMKSQIGLCFKGKKGIHEKDISRVDTLTFQRRSPLAILLLGMTARLHCLQSVITVAGQISRHLSGLFDTSQEDVLSNLFLRPLLSKLTFADDPLSAWAFVRKFCLSPDEALCCISSTC